MFSFIFQTFYASVTDSSNNDPCGYDLYIIVRLQGFFTTICTLKTLKEEFFLLLNTK